MNGEAAIVVSGKKKPWSQQTNIVYLLADINLSLKMQEWPKEKHALLKSIKEKEERLKDFEKRFLPTTIEDERVILKERELEKEIDSIKSKIATVKQEIEVLKLRKRLKELEEENAALSSLQ